MHKNFLATFFGLLLLFAKNSTANQLSVPLQIDYSLIKKILVSQLYTGKNNVAEVWNDRQGCSYLKLSNPEINGKNEQVRILNDVQARVGTGLGGQCLTILEWAGVLETFQQPTLDSGRSVLSFPITRATAYDRNGHQLTIDKLQDLIQRVVEPKLAAVKIDLNESRGKIEQTLAHFLPRDNAAEVKEILKSLRFSSINAGTNGIGIKLDFNAPAKKIIAKPVTAFSEAEQKQWQAAWQQWDSFLNSAINQASEDTKSPELRETLMGILMDSRAAFQAGLKEHSRDEADPVRVFFTDTWIRLAPVLKTVAQDLPGMQGLRYITFIAATDVIYELEQLGAPFGLDISSDGLRTLGRILIEGKQQQTISQK
jgi:phage baseplate assembly protein gpV